MFKFLVARMEEPLPLQQPAVEEHWAGADAKCRSVWRWMQGISDSCDSGTAVGTDDDAGRQRKHTQHEELAEKLAKLAQRDAAAPRTGGIDPFAEFKD